MNLRDLMIKLDTIAEADDARAQYDKFKADDAKAGAIAQVKSMLKPNGMQNFIDPKDGIVKWQEQMQGDSGGAGSVREFPFDWYKKGQNADFFNIVKTAGLEIVPVDRKNLFGTSQVAGIKGGPQALADLDKPVVAPTPAPGTVTKPDAKGNDDATKLAALVAQLEATLTGGGGGAEINTTNPVTTDTTTTDKTVGQKAGIGAGIAAGALGGAALGKKYGGAKGAVLGGLTGGALGGMGVNALQKEGTELSMAQALTESFGYDFEDEQLDEYSMDQFGKDAGDFGRGAWNGATLGAGDNIYAGVKSAFGSGTYKDELAKQTAASKEAEARSPALYTAGNIAGSLAAPIPGGLVAGGVMRGAKALGAGAKLATGVGMAGDIGANMLAQQGVDKLKSASDTKTLGYDPSKYPTTPQEIKAFQSANGLTPDGIAGPKTQAVLAKMGLTPPKPATVAEDIKSLQEKLAMIENGQWQLEEDADYRVWLTEDNTVIDDNGNQIVDESVLDAIEWDQARLDELSLGGLGKYIGRGYDAVANVGRNFAGGLAGKDATGNLIKDTEKNFASRMSAPKANGKVRSAAEIARDSTNARGTANMANKAANYVGKNPGKVALGAAALGAGGVAAANALGGGASASPAGTTTGGGASSGKTTPAVTTPVASGLTPEQQALIKQIQDLALQHGEDESPEWVQATGHMQVVLDKAQKAGPDQTAMDQSHDAPTGAASPAGTTTATQQAVPGVKAGGQVVDTRGGIGGKDEMEESADELARWLRIARG